MARILIVEDEPDIALGLQQDLLLEGYEVEVVRRRRSCAWIAPQPGRLT